VPKDADQPPHRDVAAFDERARGYDAGWRGRMHHEISDRVAALALAGKPDARQILDVGCGTGYLLRRLARALPDAERLLGIDAAPDMVAVARESTDDPRVSFVAATAEDLPLEVGFDLVVSSTSFDHWHDQPAGLAECARVLAPGGRLVLCDQFSALLAPTLIGTRRGKARTPRRASELVRRAGFDDLRWHPVYAVIIGAVTARKGG
jgi:ubiquinone/menaquinone biosynthesis C-methylase UbiE